MIKHLLSALLLTISCCAAYGQTLKQYFDGDPHPDSLVIILDTSAQNIWQVGRPQKTIFDSAATLPNALVTDTINTYPVNDTSIFTFGIKPHLRWGVFALQWKQKIDMDKKHDGGIIEFSVDSGATWQNVFNNPLVYNFYGFDTTNRDTLATGQYAFSGTDSTWRDIWLCFDYSFIATKDTIAFRYTLLTDGIDSMKEGWLIDNMMARITYSHTIKKPEQLKYLSVYPTNTTGIVHIEAEKKEEYHIIEHMVVRDAAGKVVKTYGLSPTKYWIDISGLPNGNYYLEIKTNLKKEVFPLILNK